jgi:hypothetical protein
MHAHIYDARINPIHDAQKWTRKDLVMSLNRLVQLRLLKRRYVADLVNDEPTVAQMLYKVNWLWRLRKEWEQESALA